MKPSDIQKMLPLPPAGLHILVALTAEDRHGYGIMREIERHSEGQYKLGPGTLYDNLQRLMERGLVKETSGPASNEDTRRRYYRLTAFGRQVLIADLERLRNVLREARLHLPAIESEKSS